MEKIELAHGALAAGGFVLLEQVLEETGLGTERVRELVRLLRTRGDAAVLERDAAALGDPGRELLEAVTALSAAERARIIIDVGLVRDLGYYTGLVFEILDPAVGEPIGGGGRYDALVGSFGDPRPAVGFALNVDAVHRAQTSAGAGR